MPFRQPSSHVGHKPKKPKAPLRPTGGQLVPSTRHPFDIVPPTRAQKIGRRQVSAEYAREHGHVAGGAYSQRTIKQLARSPQGREHLRQRAYALHRQQVNPGDIRGAARKQTELDKIHMAGISIPGINAPGNSIATRFVSDLTSAALGTPYGLYLGVRHPIGTSKAVVHQIGQDIRHPLRHPGFTFLDIAGAASVGAGTAARLGAIGGALSREGIGAAARAALHPPAVPLRRITHEGAEMFVEPSRNPLVRGAHRLRGTEVRERTFNRATAGRQRTRANLARGPALAVEAKGRHLSVPEQLAIRAEREQIHPADLARMYEKRSKEESGRYRRRLERRRDEWKEAAKHVVVRDGELELAPDLAKLGPLIEKVSARRESIIGSRDILPQERLALRKDAPREVVARYLGGLQHDLGEPRGYVSHQIEERRGLPGMPRTGMGPNLGSRQQLPASMRKEFSGEALLAGYKTAPTTRAIARSGLEAEKVDTWYQTFEQLRAAGKPASDPAIQEASRNGTLNRKYVALLPTKKLTVEQRQALHHLRVEAGADATPMLQQLRQRHVVGNLGSKIHSDPHAADAAAALEEAGVRFVPRGRAAALRPEIAGAPITAFKRTVDTINQATVGAFLYLGTKYEIVNTPGQLWLSITQGSLNPVNIGRAVAMHHELAVRRPDLFYGGKEALGGGAARSVVERKTAGNVVARASNVISRFAGKIIDDPYRWNSFVFHARRRGFRKTDDLIRLIEADKGPLTHERDVIVEAANRDMIDYERLGSTEKEVVRRLVLFYPWLKGSTLYGGRWLREHPAQAAVQLQMGRYANQRQRKELGQVPQFAASIFKVGTEDIPGLGRVPSVVDPTSAAIITQTPEILRSIANTMHGQGGPQLGEFASPAISATAALLNFDISRGTELHGPLQDRMQQAVVGGIPLYNLYRVANRQGRERIEYHTKSGQTRQYMYPRSGFEQLMRSVVMGGLYPSPVNPRAMHHTAQLERGKSTKRKKKSGGGGGWSWDSGGGGGSSGSSSNSWSWSK